MRKLKYKQTLEWKYVHVLVRDGSIIVYASEVINMAEHFEEEKFLSFGLQKFFFSSFNSQHSGSGRCFLSVMISHTATCWNHPDLHQVRAQVQSVHCLCSSSICKRTSPVASVCPGAHSECPVTQQFGKMLFFGLHVSQRRHVFVSPSPVSRCRMIEERGLMGDKTGKKK